MAALTWIEVKDRVLAKEPKAAPVLLVIEKYWGDGKLTVDLANRFIAAMLSGNYVEAQRLIYGSSDAAALIEADRTANAQLARWVEQETKLYNFFGELRSAILQVALGLALAMVGL